MSEEERDFEEDKTLDLYNLHIAAANQSLIFGYWSKKWAIAAKKKQIISDQLDLIRAQLESDVRRNPKLFGLPTDKHISDHVLESTVIKMEQYQIKLAEYREVSHEERILNIAKETMTHRDKGLTVLGILFKGNYFSNIPKHVERRDAEKAHEEMMDHLNKNERLKK